MVTHQGCPQTPGGRIRALGFARMGARGRAPDGGGDSGEGNDDGDSDDGSGSGSEDVGAIASAPRSTCSGIEISISEPPWRNTQPRTRSTRP